MLVEKASGCNHLTCHYCNYEWYKFFLIYEKNTKQGAGYVVACIAHFIIHYLIQLDVQL